MCRLEIVYLYNDYSGYEKEVEVIKFECDKTYTYKQAYDIAKQIMEDNENTYVNIIEVK